jgi:hypothetical protein
LQGRLNPVFGIRFFTPSVMNQDGRPQAGGELVVGGNRLGFLVDLSSWTQTDYERQWQQGISRLAHGAPSTALITAYRGPDSESPHLMYALWRDDKYVYAQELSVLPAELDKPFDPATPWDHVGDRIPAAEQGLPFMEVRCDLVTMLGAYFFPSFPWHLNPGQWGSAA